MTNIQRFGIFLGLLFLATQASSSALKTGFWEKIYYESAGQWHITEKESLLKIGVDGDFETQNAPDLHIILSPRPLNEITNENAMQGSFVVGELKTKDDALFFKKMKGSQYFEINLPFDLSQYQSILIHCIEYSHVWSGASL